MTKVFRGIAFFAAAFLLGGCRTEIPVSPDSGSELSASSLRTFVLTSPTDSRLPGPSVEDQYATSSERDMVIALGKVHANGSNQDGPPSVYWNLVTANSGSAAHLPPPA